MSFSLLQPLRDIPFAFVDTETTGVSVEFGHRVIELGIVRVENGVKVAEYSQLIDPQRGISPGVSALTGITPEMVARQPRFFEQLPMAMEFLRGAVLVGHNFRFDLTFLNKEFRRAGQAMEVALAGVMVMDTVRMARRRFGRGGNGLQRLARRIGYEPSVAHRALADAETTRFVFEKLIEPLAGWQTPLADALVAQGGPIGLLPKSPQESLLPLELEEALEQKKPVMMEYLDAREQRTQRTIQPLHVKKFKGELILVAHCHLRDEQRTFKLDRIVQLMRMEVVETTVTPSPVGESALLLMEPSVTAESGDERPKEPASANWLQHGSSTSSQMLQSPEAPSE
jgi:DNA polymerase III epsilon subunit family exonuclease